MARGFLYVYERIYKGETEMQTEFRKIPVNGKRTSVADQKRVRKIISDKHKRDSRKVREDNQRYGAQARRRFILCVPDRKSDRNVP